MASLLVKYRERSHLTQEELAELSGLSVRTIQRIEAGGPLRGYTLKTLAKALGLEPSELLDLPAGPGVNWRELRLVNLASLPFMVLPPLNIVAPLLLMQHRKIGHDHVTRQLVSLQILWTIVAAVLVLSSAFLNRLFDLDLPFVVFAAALAIIVNLFFIIRNAVAIDRQQELRIRLPFSFF